MPGPVTVTRTRTVDGLTVDLTLTYGVGPDQRGVSGTVRARAARGGHVGGSGLWATSAGQQLTSFGDLSAHPDTCDPATTSDPEAVPVDLTFALQHTFAARGADTVEVAVWSSSCWAEHALVTITVPLPTP